jgi:serine/threonine-protein phosphatase 2B regulatory subunit
LLLAEINLSSTLDGSPKPKEGNFGCSATRQQSKLRSFLLLIIKIMGKGASKLKQSDIKALLDETHFNGEEIEKLFSLFCAFSTKESSLSKEEFCTVLGLKTSLFVERLFFLLDGNQDGRITFPEFLQGLSVFSEKGTLDEKLKLSFKIYDMDNDSHISKEELSKMLVASLVENSLDLPKDQMDQMIDFTFKEADRDRDGKISFDEYRVLVASHPNILGNLTIQTTFK